MPETLRQWWDRKKRREAEEREHHERSTATRTTATHLQCRPSRLTPLIQRHQRPILRRHQSIRAAAVMAVVERAETGSDVLLPRLRTLLLLSDSHAVDPSDGAMPVAGYGDGSEESYC
jgi:hypothetical protein